MANVFKSRMFKFGIVSTVITIAVIAVIVLVNVLVTALFKKYPLNIDLTSDQIFEISGESKKFLSDLDRDVDVFILNTESNFIANAPQDYYVQANEVVRKYAQLSPRVHLTYLDLMRNPDFASRYPDQDVSLNDILVGCGGKVRVLKAADLFNIRSSMYGSYIYSSKAEQAMTGAMMSVTSRKTSRAVFLSGHGEEEQTAFMDLLRLNAWEVGIVNTITSDIPDDTQVAVLCAPTRDFSLDELRRLDAFLNIENGHDRTLFYLADPAKPELPNLNSFLADWGIGVQPGAVFETDMNRMLNNNPFLAIVDYAEDNYSKAQKTQGLFPVMPQSRPLKVLFEGQRYRRTSVLLKYSASSGIRPADADGWQPDLNHLEGNIPVLVLTTEARNDKSGDIVKNYLLASGSSLALHQQMLGSPNFANSGYFLDLLSTLAGREDHVYIMDKSVGQNELGATQGQILLLGAVFAVLLPLVVLVAGIVVWLRRRHK